MYLRRKYWPSYATYEIVGESFLPGIPRDKHRRNGLNCALRNAGLDYTDWVIWGFRIDNDQLYHLVRRSKLKVEYDWKLVHHKRMKASINEIQQAQANYISDPTRGEARRTQINEFIKTKLV